MSVCQGFTAKNRHIVQVGELPFASALLTKLPSKTKQFYSFKINILLAEIMKFYEQLSI